VTVNLFGDDWDGERDRPGWRWKYLRVGQRLGAAKLGATLYELEPGQKSFPYHYEYPDEEWLLSVSGRPTLRTPEGERELAPGDVAVFVEAPAGAHQVINRTEEPARVLILSTKSSTGVAVYPDSGKVGIFPASEQDQLLLRRDAQVDYFDRED
jgi:uncharacterized cupin superfamily protein